MTKNVKGILGEKLGMTQVWDENNKVVPVTVVKAGPCVVTQVRSSEGDGYSAVQLGFGQIDPRKVNKPETGHYAKAGVTPRRHLVELRTDDASEYTVGQELGPDVFEAGQSVDVAGTSKGKGFAGTMKRHNFKGVGASHGAHRNHRKLVKKILSWERIIDARPLYWQQQQYFRASAAGFFPRYLSFQKRN
jgi:large subunit ribosomal protein L3